MYGFQAHRDHYEAYLRVVMEEERDGLAVTLVHSSFLSFLSFFFSFIISPLAVGGLGGGPYIPPP